MFKHIYSKKVNALPNKKLIKKQQAVSKVRQPVAFYKNKYSKNLL